MDSIVGFILLIIGIWTFFSPKGAIAFKLNLLKSVGIKVKMQISPKSYRAIKYIGLIAAIVGFLILS